MDYRNILIIIIGAITVTIMEISRRKLTMEKNKTIEDIKVIDRETLCLKSIAMDRYANQMTISQICIGGVGVILGFVVKLM